MAGPTAELYAQCYPAREVSGDLYDFFRLPDGRLAFFVGDVSGKGMPAALFMIAVRTLARHLAPAASGAADFLQRLNVALAADNPTHLFVTLMLRHLRRQATAACRWPAAGTRRRCCGTPTATSRWSPSSRRLMLGSLPVLPRVDRHDADAEAGRHADPVHRRLPRGDGAGRHDAVRHRGAVQAARRLADGAAAGACAAEVARRCGGSWAPTSSRTIRRCCCCAATSNSAARSW